MEAEDAGDVRIDWWCQRLGCWLLKVYGSFGGEARRAEIVRERYSGSFLFRSLIACRNAEYWGVCICGREKWRMECGMSVFLKFSPFLWRSLAEPCLQKGGERRGPEGEELVSQAFMLTADGEAGDGV